MAVRKRLVLLQVEQRKEKEMNEPYPIEVEILVLTLEAIVNMNLEEQPDDAAQVLARQALKKFEDLNEGETPAPPSSTPPTSGRADGARDQA